MAWIRVIGPDEADSALAARYAKLADPETGVVDNVLTIHGLDPVGLDAHLGLYRSAMRNTATLPKVDREMIAVIVSKLNGCHY